MHVSNLLKTKGPDVVTVAPDADVHALLDLLAEHGIGAVVVSGDGKTVEGIASERDVVRALASRGSAVLDERVSAISTPAVHTVEPEANVDDLMGIMTDARVRHVPVVSGGVLAGIVSIGDVVKHRMDELETERDALEQYVTSGG
jgi:CBS domain-containing protein